MAAPGTDRSQDLSDRAEDTAERVHGSGPVEALARLGLASRGLVWLVIGLLAGSLVVRGGGGEEADQQGALRAIASKPFGEVLLVVLVVGFLGYAVWQGLTAAVGHGDEDSGSKAVHRLQSAGKTLLYLGLAGSVLRFLLSGSSGDKTQSLTGRLMAQPGGRWLVGLVGVVVVGAAVWLGARALKGTHERKIDAGAVPGGHGRLAVRIGSAGLLGRALVLALIGAFLVGAAVHADPEEAKGLDAALKTLAQQPYGRVLLGIAVLGLLAYAAWSFVEAAFHRHDSGAS